MWSLLEITGIEVGDFASRSIVMSLEPIAQAVRQRRTINGALKDVSRAAFFKYRVSISCTDHESPVLYSVAPGTAIGIRCVEQLGTNSTDTDGVQQQLELSCLVESWRVTRDEREADTGWELTANEI